MASELDRGRSHQLLAAAQAIALSSVRMGMLAGSLHEGGVGDEAELRALIERLETELAVVRLIGGYAKSPVLKIVWRELIARGWKVTDEGAYVDPEGNHYFTLEEAIRGQSMREIAEM